MDQEKMQRQMEFIVDQQAQFAVQHAQSAVRVAQLEELLVRFAQATRDRFEAADRRAQEMDEKIAALIDAQAQAEDRAADLDGRFAALVDSQMKTEETVRRLGEDVRKTEEAVRKVGENINNLSAVVERHIVEGHNGRARADG